MPPGKKNLPVVSKGNPLGQGTYYCEAVVTEIIDRMCHGETLIAICRFHRDGSLRAYGTFPNHRTVYDWGDPLEPCSHAEFIPRFARAKLIQQQCWLEQCIDIANTPHLGVEDSYTETAKGSFVKTVTKDALGHRALQIDTRLKVLARMNPQLWSERLQQAAEGGQAADGASPNKLIIEGGLPDNEPPPPSVDEGTID